MDTESFPVLKRPGRGVHHPPLSGAEVKGRVKLYLYSHSGPSWPVIGRTLLLSLPLREDVRGIWRNVLKEELHDLHGNDYLG
jgi:hypothetical protein